MITLPMLLILQINVINVMMVFRLTVSRSHIYRPVEPVMLVDVIVVLQSTQLQTLTLLDIRLLGLVLFITTQELQWVGARLAQLVTEYQM
jgi:hypothetical protein